MVSRAGVMNSESEALLQKGFRPKGKSPFSISLSSPQKGLINRQPIVQTVTKPNGEKVKEVNPEYLQFISQTMLQPKFSSRQNARDASNILHDANVITDMHMAIDRGSIKDPRLLTALQNLGLYNLPIGRSILFNHDGALSIHSSRQWFGQLQKMAEAQAKGIGTGGKKYLITMSRDPEKGVQELNPIDNNKITSDIDFAEYARHFIKRSRIKTPDDPEGKLNPITKLVYNPDRLIMSYMRKNQEKTQQEAFDYVNKLIENLRKEGVILKPTSDLYKET